MTACTHRQRCELLQATYQGDYPGTDASGIIPRSVGIETKTTIPPLSQKSEFSSTRENFFGSGGVIKLSPNKPLREYKTKSYMESRGTVKCLPPNTNPRKSLSQNKKRKNNPLPQEQLKTVRVKEVARSVENETPKGLRMNSRLSKRRADLLRESRGKDSN